MTSFLEYLNELRQRLYFLILCHTLPYAEIRVHMAAPGQLDVKTDVKKILADVGNILKDYKSKCLSKDIRATAHLAYTWSNHNYTIRILIHNPYKSKDYGKDLLELSSSIDVHFKMGAFDERYVETCDVINGTLLEKLNYEDNE